jgi:S-formylglutathione hydrolase FrmB
MPIHNFVQPKGRVVELTLESEFLADNLLGDPGWRTVAVYLPEGYDDSEEGYPVFMDLAGFTGSGLKRLSWASFGESVPQRIDRLVAEGKMGPVIAVFPDCFTSLGGNQYINSSAMGRWADFLNLDVLPRIESEFRALGGREKRAVYGKSSGGYGAIVYGMRYADIWGAVACHSGDMAFDLVYKPDFSACLDGLAKHDGDILAFLKHLEEQKKIRGGDFHALMTLAMAATYDPDPLSPKGIRLPVDLRTCALDEAAWKRWLQHDPVVMVDRGDVQQNLVSLKGCFIDCGWRDQYRLHHGARQLVSKLTACGVQHTYEEFDDNHSNIDYRLDRSLPFLYASLMGT